MVRMVNYLFVENKMFEDEEEGERMIMESEETWGPPIKIQKEITKFSSPQSEPQYQSLLFNKLVER